MSKKHTRSNREPKKVKVIKKPLAAEAAILRQLQSKQGLPKGAPK